MTVMHVSIDKARRNQFFPGIHFSVDAPVKIQADIKYFIIFNNNDAIAYQIMTPVVVSNNPTGLDRGAH